MTHQIPDIATMSPFASRGPAVSSLEPSWRTLADQVRADARLAMRTLRRSPGFTIAAVAIVGLGIGVTTAMFTIYRTVLVDRLPVMAQDRLVVMHPLDRRGTHLDAPYPYLAEVARDTAVFRGAAGVYHLGAQSLPFMDGDTPVVLGAANPSANFFDVVGVRPILGRFFHADDGRAGAPPVIVLTYAAWRRRFAGDPAIVGRVLILPYTEQRARVIGVAPPGFEYPTGTDVWLPIPSDFTAQVDVVARLAPGVTISTARHGFFTLTQRVNPFAGTSPGRSLPPRAFEVSGVDVQPFVDTVLGKSRPAIVALTVAVALLLLIACVNVGNLMLVRLLARYREIAVRRAIGASYGAVARLFLIESTLIAVVGGAVGASVAVGLVRAIVIAAPPQLPRTDALGIVTPPLGLAISITVLAMMLFGVGPSLVAARVSSYAALRADTRTGGSGESPRRMRRWLVSAQMALAIVMLSGAALLVRTLARLQSMDLGYEPAHLSMLSFTGPQKVFSTPERVLDVAKALLARIETTAGVVAATPIESGPFKGQSFFIMKLAPAEQPASEREHAPFVPFEFVGPDYFRTFGVQLREGRGFLPSDTKTAEKVTVISETLARQLWPGQSAVGKRLAKDQDHSTWTVVGVASDTHLRELTNVGPVAYFDWEQVEPFWNGYIAVRTTRPLAATLPALRTTIHDVNARLVLIDAQTMDHLLDAPLAQPRLIALLLAGFSVVALLLSAIGLYGVMSSAVRQQTREIGVRIALGATPRDVRRLVLAEAVSMVGLGAVVGLAGATVAGRLLASQLFGVSPLDPISLAGAVALLVAIGLIASHLPARRASRIDPVDALRAE